MNRNKPFPKKKVAKFRRSKNHFLKTAYPVFRETKILKIVKKIRFMVIK